MSGIGEVAAGIGTHSREEPVESERVRMYRKALAKEQDLTAKMVEAAEEWAIRTQPLRDRMERWRRPVASLESKVRDAKTQRLVRWQKLTGGEQGHLALSGHHRGK